MTSEGVVRVPRDVGISRRRQSRAGTTSYRDFVPRPDIVRKRRADHAERAVAVLAGAAKMWGTFGRELYESHDWLERRAACEMRCRGLIGDRAYGAAYAHGSTLSREETLALALVRVRD